MLVLSRKTEESIMIGDDIEIIVVEVKGEQVKLGVRAPRSVAVHRKEIYKAIEEANIEASKTEVKSIAGLAQAFRKKPGAD